MKNLLLALLTLLSFSSYAQMPSKIEPYTSICEEDKSTGFSWINSFWEQANFKKSKYAIVKFTDKEASKMCLSENDKSIKHVSDLYSVTSACYNVRDINIPFSKYSSLMCNEYYSSGTIDSVVCDNSWTKITFNPNGNFIASNVHGNITNNPNKDSIKISVGKCSITDFSK